MPFAEMEVYLCLEAIATLAFVRDDGWNCYTHRTDLLLVDKTDHLDPIAAAMIFCAGSTSYRSNAGNCIR